MNVRLLHLVSIPVAACHGGGTIAPASEFTCAETLSGSAIGVDVVSSLGFSGRDAADAVGGELAVTVTSEDGTLLSNVLTFDFAPDAMVQAAERSAFDGNSECIVGSVLLVEGTLTIASADGWVAGSGAATLTAQGTDADQLWLEARFEVTPSADLHAVAATRNTPECAASDLMVTYRHAAVAQKPWSADLGTVEFESCNVAGVLYWVAPAE